MTVRKRLIFAYGIMMFGLRTIAKVTLGCVLAVFSSESIYGYTAKSAPVMTKWAENVDIKAPHPEYPRPQMVRDEWLNLNGVWEFGRAAQVGDDVPVGQTLGGEILVPFPVESALSGVMEMVDRFWYRRMFRVPTTWSGKRVMLRFGAVDYESEVFVNGRTMGVHRGGYLPFGYDITDALRDGDNELVVRVYDPTDNGGQPRGKQDTDPKGIMYTPTSGIWQTVWLEPVPEVCIRDYKVVTDIDKNEVEITVLSDTDDADVRLTLDGRTYKGKTNRPMKIRMENPVLWEPGNPHLYDFTVTIPGRRGKSGDEVRGYFGMRKISVGDVDGVKRLFVNNKPVFMNGPLDQGFWPDGLYTAPTDEALRFDIEQTLRHGFNFTRKHIKVEPARWYYWCDRLGLMVWQDAPSCNSYLDRDRVAPELDRQAFEDGLIGMVDFLKNSPAVVMWVVFNEGQGQFDTERLVTRVRAADPTRLVNDASGGQWSYAGDVLDVHHYPAPTYPHPAEADRDKAGGKVLVCGEFGGIGMKVPGHMWFEGRGSGYANVDRAEDLLFKYAEFYAMVDKMRRENGIAAVVYTELTDIMTEINGLFTYDRVPKLDAEKVAKINRFEFVMPDFEAVVPTSENTPQMWRYRLGPRKGAWNKPGFDDSSWIVAEGAFGDAAGIKGRTPWPSGEITDDRGRTVSEICLRRTFTLPELSPDDISRLMLRIMHDENIDVFINGVLAFNTGGFNTSYEYFPIRSEALEALRPGDENEMAVYCRDTAGGRFVDVGIYLRGEIK